MSAESVDWLLATTRDVERNITMTTPQLTAAVDYNATIMSDSNVLFQSIDRLCDQLIDPLID